MRIAIATVGTTGDVLPFVSLSAALRGRGHEVTALSWDLHRPGFEEAGIRFDAAGPATSWDQVAETARLAAGARSPLDQVAVLRDFHLRDGEAHYRALRELLPGHDLVLLHGIHSLAEAAARDAGLRWATAVFDPILLPTASYPPPGVPSLGPFNRVAWGLLDRVLGRVGSPLGALLRRAGSHSAADVRLFRARSPLLHLVAASPALARVPHDLPSHVHVSGAWVPTTPPAPLPDEVVAFLERDSPPVVITFGSMAFPGAERLSGIVADGLRRVGLRGIIQPGAAGLAVEPAADRLVIDQLDHRSLFPRAAAIVHHGGAGTSHAAAAAGVPSVVVPHIGDQAYWAIRLHRLGAAPAPLAWRRLDAATLASRLQQAGAESISAAARRLSDRLRREDGPAEAVRLLEGIVPEHS